MGVCLCVCVCVSVGLHFSFLFSNNNRIDGIRLYFPFANRNHVGWIIYLETFCVLVAEKKWGAEGKRTATDATTKSTSYCRVVWALVDDGFWLLMNHCNKFMLVTWGNDDDEWLNGMAAMADMVGHFTWAHLVLNDESFWWIFSKQFFDGDGAKFYISGVMLNLNLRMIDPNHVDHLKRIVTPFQCLCNWYGNAIQWQCDVLRYQSDHFAENAFFFPSFRYLFHSLSLFLVFIPGANVNNNVWHLNLNWD